MILYSDTAPRGQFKGNVWDMDANKHYLKHYDNMLYLRFMARKGTFQERTQAEHEMKICRRKLNFWAQHPNYDDDYIKPIVAEKNKTWGM